MLGQLGAELCRESVSPVVGGARNEGKAERCVVLPLVTPGSQQVDFSEAVFVVQKMEEVCLHFVVREFHGCCRGGYGGEGFAGLPRRSEWLGKILQGCVLCPRFAY